ncbi:MAG TPA: hypothetical protein VGZ93_06715 [Candidatus Methylacidiphilales bacterium]|jgi:hypothetical protein|nr:hypothetical protein [Candidatus Methylacidiphilales bacterium]
MSAPTDRIPTSRYLYYLVRTSIILFAGLFFGIVILVAVGITSDFLLDRRYDEARARLDPKLRDAGFTPSVTNEANSLTELSSKSPDGAWAMTAQSVSGRGWNWGIRNNKTGKVYFQDEKIQSNRAFPDGCSALWSPDSRYVAVATAWGTDTDYVSVINLSGVDPTFTAFSGDGPDYYVYPLKDILLKPADASIAGEWMEQRTEALKWENPTDLNLVAYLIIRLGDFSKPERAAAAHLTLRFSGNAFTVLARHDEFYEELPVTGSP